MVVVIKSFVKFATTNLRIYQLILFIYYRGERMNFHSLAQRKRNLILYMTISPTFTLTKSRSFKRQQQNKK
jgi:hypothetical protein